MKGTSAGNCTDISTKEHIMLLKYKKKTADRFVAAWSMKTLKCCFFFYFEYQVSRVLFQWMVKWND